MRVHIEMLRQRGELQEVLQSDGWQLRTEPDNCFSASHPQVADEATARNRLHDLGLLTSGSVRIEFGNWPA